MLRTLFAFLIPFLLAVPSTAQEDEISFRFSDPEIGIGHELLKELETMDDALAAMAEVELTEAEIVFVTKRLPAMEAWVRSNPGPWKAADDAHSLAAFRELWIWSWADIECDVFMAVLLKSIHAGTEESLALVEFAAGFGLLTPRPDVVTSSIEHGFTLRASGEWVESGNESPNRFNYTMGNNTSLMLEVSRGDEMPSLTEDMLQLVADSLVEQGAATQADVFGLLPHGNAGKIGIIELVHEEQGVQGSVCIVRGGDQLAILTWTTTKEMWPLLAPVADEANRFFRLHSDRPPLRVDMSGIGLKLHATDAWTDLTAESEGFEAYLTSRDDSLTFHIISSEVEDVTEVETWLLELLHESVVEQYESVELLHRLVEPHLGHPAGYSEYIGSFTDEDGVTRQQRTRQVVTAHNGRIHIFTATASPDSWQTWADEIDRIFDGVEFL